MGDEQIKNSTFLESNNQLEDLKLQVLNIEHNYITVSDLDNYVTSYELHNYVTSYDFENTNVEIYNLKNKSNILSSKMPNNILNKNNYIYNQVTVGVVIIMLMFVFCIQQKNV